MVKLSLRTIRTIQKHSNNLWEKGHTTKNFGHTTRNKLKNKVEK